LSRATLHRVPMPRSDGDHTSSRLLSMTAWGRPSPPRTSAMDRIDPFGTRPAMAAICAKRTVQIALRMSARFAPRDECASSAQRRAATRGAPGEADAWGRFAHSARESAILVDMDTTLAAVLELPPRAACFHASTHGHHHPIRPTRSGAEAGGRGADAG
jgi:hypothetical protein